MHCVGATRDELTLVQARPAVRCCVQALGQEVRPVISPTGRILLPSVAPQPSTQFDAVPFNASLFLSHANRNKRSQLAGGKVVRNENHHTHYDSKPSPLARPMLQVVFRNM